MQSPRGTRRKEWTYRSCPCSSFHPFTRPRHTHTHFVPGTHTHQPPSHGRSSPRSARTPPPSAAPAGSAGVPSPPSPGIPLPQPVPHLCDEGKKKALQAQVAAGLVAVRRKRRALRTRTLQCKIPGPQRGRLDQCPPPAQRLCPAFRDHWFEPTHSLAPSSPGRTAARKLMESTYPRLCHLSRKTASLGKFFRTAASALANRRAVPHRGRPVVTLSRPAERRIRPCRPGTGFFRPIAVGQSRQTACAAWAGRGGRSSAAKTAAARHATPAIMNGVRQASTPAPLSRAASLK